VSCGSFMQGEILILFRKVEKKKRKLSIGSPGGGSSNVRRGRFFNEGEDFRVVPKDKRPWALWKV